MFDRFKNHTFALALIAAAAAGLTSTSGAQIAAFDHGMKSQGNSNIWNFLHHSSGGHALSSNSGAYLQLSRSLLKYLKKKSGSNAGKVFAKAKAGYANADVRAVFDGDFVRSAAATLTNGYSVMKSVSWQQSLNIFPVDPSMTVYIIAIPVSLGGNAGVGINIQGYAYAIPGSLSAGGGNTSSAWANGRAWVMIGIPGFGVGVEAQAKFATATLTASVAAGMSKVVAKGKFSFTAISVRVKPFLWLIVKIYGPTIASFSSKSHSRQLF